MHSQKNDFSTKYDHYKSLINTRIQSIAKSSEPSILYDPCKYILSTGGKRVRGVLILFITELFANSGRQFINSAAAIEILHLFTLVHDDIMDNADLRRGIKTIHKKWDSNIAILSGDVLIGLAYDLLLKTDSKNINEVSKVFTKAIIDVCEGQAYDKYFETKKEITVREYYKMIDFKTGKLIEASSVIGALLGDAKTEEIKALKNYGANIGRAFQIKDDLLDLIGTEKDLGKLPYSDIKERKKTYFYSYAYHLFTKKDFLSLKKLYFLNTRGEKEIKEVLNLYEKYNLLNKAHVEIDSLVNQSKEYLEIFPKNKRKFLIDFADMLAKRNY